LFEIKEKQEKETRKKKHCLSSNLSFVFFCWIKH